MEEEGTVVISSHVCIDLSLSLRMLLHSIYETDGLGKQSLGG